MHPVEQKYVCWRCGATYDADMKFCGQCGADMHRASCLAKEAREEHDEAMGRESDDPWIGRIVDNRYRIVETVGAGGMGVVYKVEHQRMGKIAALKMLHPELAREPEVQKRFHREAEAVSKLNHHNTVQVFDFGSERGALYLVMEYVRGIDLGELVERDGPLPFPAAAPIFAQICASLVEAHELGIVHRDLKPENIVVTRTSRGRDFVKVLDFGLAKLNEREDLSAVTGRGNVVGTPYYMSPEQIRGESIDARSDIYALGCLMYKVLTGDPPFEANSPVGVLTKHLTDEARAPSRKVPELNIDPRADRIVMRCLEKEAKDRYRSAGELAEAIEQLFADVDSASQPSRQLYVGSGARPATRRRATDSGIGSGFELSGEERLQRADIDAFERRLKRRRTVRVVLIPLLLLGLAGGAAYWTYWSRLQPQAHEVEPNNDVAAATKVRSGTVIPGRIGKRLSESQGDMDFFVLADAVPTDGTMTISVHLRAQPNIDMLLELVDGSGTPVVKANGHGLGGDEWLRRYRVTSPVRILVEEAPGDALPVESISDHYQLEIDIAPVDPRLETEPNDLGGDAMPIGPGQPITAHFDHTKDVDVYRWAGPKGRFRPVVSGAQAVELRRGDSVVSGALDLSPGDLIEARAAGDATDAPYTIDLTPAP